MPESASLPAGKFEEGHTLPHQGGDWSCSRCVESLRWVIGRMTLTGFAFI